MKKNLEGFPHDIEIRYGGEDSTGSEEWSITTMSGSGLQFKRWYNNRDMAFFSLEMLIKMCGTENVNALNIADAWLKEAEAEWQASQAVISDLALWIDFDLEANGWRWHLNKTVGCGARVAEGFLESGGYTSAIHAGSDWAARNNGIVVQIHIDMEV